jgi:hypothetical protein
LGTLLNRSTVLKVIRRSKGIFVVMGLLSAEGFFLLFALFLLVLLDGSTLTPPSLIAATVASALSSPSCLTRCWGLLTGLSLHFL